MDSTTSLCVRNVGEEAWLRFQDYVFHKHRKLRGVLGKELTAAMELYILSESEKHKAHTQTQASGSKTIYNLRGLASEVIAFSQGEIPQTVVEKMIMNKIGGDTRTIEKYLHLLEMHGVLEMDRRIAAYPTNSPKYIFTVNQDAAVSIGRLS